VFDVIKKKYIDVIIRNDLLFKRRNGEILLVVPKSMRTQLIKPMHDQNYFSAAKSEAFLLREYFIPNAKSKIEKVIHNCVTCILVEKKQGKQNGYLNMIEKGELSLDTFHINHLGTLPTTRKNYRYIFAIIDAFTIHYSLNSYSYLLRKPQT